MEGDRGRRVGWRIDTAEAQQLTLQLAEKGTRGGRLEEESRLTSRLHPLHRLNKPINAAFACVLKLRLNPTIAADVSDVTGSVSCETANTVKM
jgi:hypothetical protein